MEPYWWKLWRESFPGAPIPEMGGEEFSRAIRKDAKKCLARELLKSEIDCEQKSAYVTLGLIEKRLRKLAEEGA